MDQSVGQGESIMKGQRSHQSAVKFPFCSSVAVCQVEGKEVPGPHFDFGLLMFHCGKTLFENKSGPFFYLSKVRHIITQHTNVI